MREESLRKGLGVKKRVLKSQVHSLRQNQQKGKWFPRADEGIREDPRKKRQCPGLCGTC